MLLADVVKGIGFGCVQSGCALIGGETAEMPGMYHEGDYDLAGFCVGVVERSKIIDGSKVKAGDTIIGLSSAGPHSNGFSLIRKILEREPIILEDNPALTAQLLAPTKIYVKSVLSALEKIDIHALAHITGGGITENLPRVLPENCAAKIDRAAWKQAECFDWLKEVGNVEELEMLKTFNCGIGMIMIVDKNDAELCLSTFSDLGEQAQIIGLIETLKSGAEPVSYINL